MQQRAEAAEATTADLMSQLDRSQSTVEQHQAQLREAKRANAGLSTIRDTLAAEKASAVQLDVRHILTQLGLVALALVLTFV